MKVYLRVRPPSPSLGLQVFLGFLGVLALVAVIYSEWSAAQMRREMESRSQAIWSAVTLVAAAESDYHTAYWVSNAHQVEAESILKRQLNSFGRFRSRQEWDEWKRLNAVITRRFGVERAAQVGAGDYQFTEQMAALRAAIEKTDQAERARVNAAAAELRGQLWMRLFGIGLLAVLAVGAHFALLSRRGSRRIRRRRRSDEVQGLSIK